MPRGHPGQRPALPGAAAIAARRVFDVRHLKSAAALERLGMPIPALPVGGAAVAAGSAVAGGWRGGRGPRPPSTGVAIMYGRHLTLDSLIYIFIFCLFFLAMIYCVTRRSPWPGAWGDSPGRGAGCLPLMCRLRLHAASKPQQ